MYESLRTDLNKIEDANCPDQNINSIINQLIQFLTARIQLIDLYPLYYQILLNLCYEFYLLVHIVTYD